jgi:hypothetical protein
MAETASYKGEILLKALRKSMKADAALIRFSVRTQLF